MKVDLTTEEMLSLTSGPVVHGRDITHAAPAAQAKLWAAIEASGEITRDGHWAASNREEGDG
jgi:hypothetical protein